MQKLLLLALVLFSVNSYPINGSLLFCNTINRWSAGDLLLYDLATETMDTLYKGKAYGACFSPDGKKVAFTIEGTRPIQIIDLVTERLDSLNITIEDANLSWATDNCIYWGRHRNIYKIHSVTEKISVAYTIQMTYSPVSADTQIAGVLTGGVALNGERGAFALWSDNIGNRSVSMDFVNKREIAINDGANTRLSCQATISSNGEYVATANYNHKQIIIRPYNSNSITTQSLSKSDVWMLRFSRDEGNNFIFRCTADSGTYKYEITSDTSIKPELVFKGPCAFDYYAGGWVRDLITASDSVSAINRFTTSPRRTTIEPNQSVAVSVTSLDQYGLALSTAISWSVSGGGTINSDGLFQSDGTEGSFIVFASPQDRSDIIAESYIAVEHKNLAIAKSVSSSSHTWFPAPWKRVDLTNGIIESPLGTIQEGGWASACNPVTDSTEWVEVDLGSDVNFSRVTLCPTHYITESYAAKLSHGKSLGFPVDFIVEARSSSGAVDTIVAQTGYPMPNYGVPQEFVTKPVSARYVRATATKLGNTREKNCYKFQLVELKVQNVPTTHEEVKIPNSVTGSFLTAVPNPAVSFIDIRYGLPSGRELSNVNISLFDMCGRLVAKVSHKGVKSGTHYVRLGEKEFGRKLTTGVYLCQMLGSGFNKSVRVVVAR
jgi:hypothetical protein